MFEADRARAGSEPPPDLAASAGLVHARWALILAVALLAVAATAARDRADLAAAGLPEARHGTAFVVVVVAWVGLNLGSWRRLKRRVGGGPGELGLQLVADVVALTALLAATGAAANPFTALYFVPITLATQVSPRWAGLVGASALLGFGVLLAVGPDVPAGPHAHHFVGHLRGMWVALAVAAALVTYLVHRIARARARERAELTRLRQIALEDRHLTALGTLAAGAAHELATPLGTVQVLVGELEHLDPAERGEAVAEIRGAVGRCKAILARMASPEVRYGDDPAAQLPVRDWSLEALAAGLETLATEQVRVVCDLRGSISEPGPSRVPSRVGVEQVLRELVHNAVQAGTRAGGASVRVWARPEAGALRAEVEDDAGGLDPDHADRALEPFFTTASEGEGMGLGLYLARAQLRQAGGTMQLENRPGQGLKVTVCWPLTPGEGAP